LKNRGQISITNENMNLIEVDIQGLKDFQESTREEKDTIKKIHEKGMIRVEFTYMKNGWELIDVNIKIKGGDNLPLTYEDLIVLDKILNKEDYH